MDGYRRVKTTREVWAVLHASHPDMCVYGSFSDPRGGWGDGTVGKMFTSYALPGTDRPIIEAETKWDIDPDDESRRLNERTTFWLYVEEPEED